jgi:subtilisin family serine protease
MKSLLFVCAALLALQANARAERVIVKNPRNPVAAANAIRAFDFGGDRYVVMNVPRFSALEADLVNGSDGVVPDLEISLPADAVSADDGDKAWHPAQMHYDQLPAETDGRGVVVAVLDTGMDYTHPALKDHVWTNEKEIPGNGIDDDGNGWIDDVHGYDFSSDDSDPMDEDQHGTHCSGIIAASLNPDNLAQGVAPGVKVMPVRIIGSEQVGFISDAVAGIKYAVDNGAKVLSNSWRVYQSWRNYDPSDTNVELLRKAIEYAGEKGAIFVAAAGNESRDLDNNSDPMYPGGYTGLTNLVVVASSDKTGSMSYFSNFGPTHVAVAAPGSDILSTVPGNAWQSMSGTSMATPLVAGSLARGLSAAFTPAEAMERLVATTSTADGWNTRVRSGGVINLVNYLKK